MFIGIDWGGTKIEGVAMRPDGVELLRLRRDTPREDYAACIQAVAQVIADLEAQTGQRGQIGIGIPGSLAPKSRLAKGASATWILNKPVEADLRAVFERRDRGPHLDAICLQAGLALHVAGRAATIAAGIDKARQAVASGQAQYWLVRLQQWAAHP